MGSRPPRQQPLPHPIRPASPAPEAPQAGLSMATLGPFIGLAAFPVALGAAFIGYAASGETATIAIALVATAVLAAVVWLIARSRPAWRRNARVGNELLAAMLVAVIGFMFFIGGIAALAPVWIVVGAAVLGGAWLIQRAGARA